MIVLELPAEMLERINSLTIPTVISCVYIIEMSDQSTSHFAEWDRSIGIEQIRLISFQQVTHSQEPLSFPPLRRVGWISKTKHHHEAENKNRAYCESAADIWNSNIRTRPVRQFVVFNHE